MMIRGFKYFLPMSSSATQPRTGASIFFDVLVDLGVEYIFGHTGGAVIPLHVELNKRMRRGEKVPRFILFRQEGGAGHAAEGYARVTGNTSAQRGRAAFAGFAPTKAAQRILAESLARDLGPKGVHVAYLVIDAAIDVPWQRELQPDKPDNYFISPKSIADEVFHLAHQPRDAWSFLAEVRPFHEPW